jgi:hypothetical protein
MIKPGGKNQITNSKNQTCLRQASLSAGVDKFQMPNAKVEFRNSKEYKEPELAVQL